MSHNNSAVVFLIHGTRNPQAGEKIHEAMKDLCPKFSPMVDLPEDAVVYSFLEGMAPLLPDVLAQLCRQQKTEIRIIPLLLFPGTHLYKDIPEIAEQVMQQFPDVKIHLGRHIGVDEPEFLEILMKRL